MVDKDEEEICEDSVNANPIKAMKDENVNMNRHEYSKSLATGSSIKEFKVPGRPSVRMKFGQTVMGDVLPDNTDDSAGKDLVAKQNSKISSTEVELDKGLFFSRILS